MSRKKKAKDGTVIGRRVDNGGRREGSGRPRTIRPGESVNTGVTVERGLMDRAKEFCTKNNRTFSGVINEALEIYLELKGKING